VDPPETNPRKGSKPLFGGPLVFSMKKRLWEGGNFFGGLFPQVFLVGENHIRSCLFGKRKGDFTSKKGKRGKGETLFRPAKKGGKKAENVATSTGENSTSPSQRKGNDGGNPKHRGIRRKGGVIKRTANYRVGIYCPKGRKGSPIRPPNEKKRTLTLP